MLAAQDAFGGVIADEVFQGLVNGFVQEFFEGCPVNVVGEEISNCSFDDYLVFAL
jgi:hypothetical protein